MWGFKMVENRGKANWVKPVLRNIFHVVLGKKEVDFFQQCIYVFKFNGYVLFTSKYI